MDKLSGSPNIKNIVRDSSGESWKEYKTKLDPIYTKVWFDIAVVYSMVVSGVVLLCDLQMEGYFYLPLIVIWIGFWMHSLINFYHEAVHFNILSSRKWNDIVATILFTPFSGVNVKAFRKSHWRHNINLGQKDDTEISYHSPLSFKTILQTALGITI